MKNKYIFTILIILLILTVVTFVLQTNNFKKKKNIFQIMTKKDYNVIFVCFDGLQAKHLHEYGYPLETTPNLDSFLKKSTLFLNAISPAPWTVPAHMSIFTSMLSSEHKVVNKFVEYDKAANKMVGANLNKLRPDAVTLAQILKQRGYRTAAFTGDAGVSASFGFDAGFDTFYQTDKPFQGFDETIPLALNWLSLNKNDKFFLFLHGYDVHGQNQPKDGYDYRYVNKPYHGVYSGSTKEQAALREEGLDKGDLTMSDEDIAFWRAVYDEKINRTDEKFGYFIKQIDKMGLLQNTVVVVFSDHGTEFMEHKKFDHGHSLYSEIINVLMAFYVPDKKSQIIKEPVSTLDIFPTIFGLLDEDISPIKQVRGYDLSLVIDDGGAVPKRNIFSETDYRLYTHKRSIQTPDGWKLIMTIYNSGNEKELYNLKNDPNETVNLIHDQPRIGYELEQLVYNKLNEMQANGPWNLGCLPVYSDQCQ